MKKIVFTLSVLTMSFALAGTTFAYTPIAARPRDTIEAAELLPANPIAARPRDTVAVEEKTQPTLPIAARPRDTVTVEEKTQPTLPIAARPRDTVTVEEKTQPTLPIAARPRETVTVTEKKASSGLIAARPRETAAAAEKKASNGLIAARPRDTAAAAKRQSDSLITPRPDYSAEDTAAYGEYIVTLAMNAMNDLETLDSRMSAFEANPTAANRQAMLDSFTAIEQDIQDLMDISLPQEYAAVETLYQDGMKDLLEAIQLTRKAYASTNGWDGSLEQQVTEKLLSANEKMQRAAEMTMSIS